MPIPDDIGTFGLAVYQQLRAWQYAEDQTEFTLAKFCGAYGQIFEQLNILARAGSDGIPWATLVDLDRIPDEGLSWLGQMVGVFVDLGLAPDRQRQQIREHESWNRGTPAFLASGVRPYLTGTQTVDIVERDTSPYHFEVITYGDETPSSLTFEDIYNDYTTFEVIYEAFDTLESLWLTDPQAFIEYIISVRTPGGLQFSYTIVAGAPGTSVTFETLFVHYATMQIVYEEFETFQDVYTSAV